MANTGLKVKKLPSRAQIGRWVHDLLIAGYDIQEVVDGLENAVRADERLREIDKAIDGLDYARAGIDAVLGDLRTARGESP